MREETRDTVDPSFMWWPGSSAETAFARGGTSACRWLAPTCEPDTTFLSILWSQRVACVLNDRARLPYQLRIQELFCDDPGRAASSSGYSYSN